MEKVLWLGYQKLTKLFFIQGMGYSQNSLFHLIKLTDILYVGFIRIKQNLSIKDGMNGKNKIKKINRLFKTMNVKVDDIPVRRNTPRGEQ